MTSAVRAGPTHEPAERAPRAMAVPVLRAAPLATAACAGIALFAALSCVMMLWWPLGYDHGIFASNGDILLHGGVPYRDAFELRGPLAFYVTAAIQLLFGRHAWGLRVFDVGIALTTAWMLHASLRAITTPRVALVAAALWPVAVASLTYDGSAQFDLWAGTAMLGAAVAMGRADGYRRRDLLLAGALIALASLTKPFYPAFLVVPAAVVMLRHRHAPAAAAARDVGWLVAGWIAPVALTAAGLSLHGALGAAWSANIVYNLTVYAPASEFSAFPSRSSGTVRLHGMGAFLSRPIVMLLLAPLAAGAVALWRRSRPFAVATVGWVLVGVGFVLLQNKFWPYHWSVIYPAFVLLAAVGFHAAMVDSRRSDTRATATLALTCLAAVITTLSVRPAIDMRRWLRYVSGRQDDAWYYRTFLQYGSIDPAEERAVAAYLRANTPPGTPFAHWSLDGSLAFLADRPNATRFHNKRVLMGPLLSPSSQALRAEFLERVRTVRPTYLVVSERTGGADSATSAELLRAEFPALADLAAERYAVEARVGLVDLYRLRAPDSLRLQR